MVEKAREEDMFSHEKTPIEERVEAAYLDRAGLSYRRVVRAAGRSDGAVRQSYHQLAYLSGSEPDHHATVTVDETKVSVKDNEEYVWAAAHVATFDVVHIEASPGRFDLDVLLILKTVLKRCRGQPVIAVDCGL